MLPGVLEKNFRQLHCISLVRPVDIEAFVLYLILHFPFKTIYLPVNITLFGSKQQAASILCFGSSPMVTIHEGKFSGS